MDNSSTSENLGISASPILRRRRLNASKLFDKNSDRTARQVKRNSREINLLKKVVILNTNRISQLISTQTENAQDSQREEDRQQQLGDESNKSDKKEGLLERVGKSVKKTLLAPVEAVGKTVKGVLSNLGTVFMTLFAGFVTNKAIKMIQAKMSGDDETFKKMRNTIIKSVAVVGGIFLALNGGLLALPAIITGVVSGIIAIGGAILAFLVSPAGLIALAIAGGVGAFLGLKKIFNKNKEKKIQQEKMRGKPIKNSRGRTIGYEKPKGDVGGNTSVGNEKVDPYVVLENNRDLIKPMLGFSKEQVYDKIKGKIDKDPSKFDTKEEINAALSKVGVDPSKVKYKSSNLNIKSSKSEPTINSVPKKQDVSTLEEAPPNIVDATTNASGGGSSTLGEKKIATSLPNISSSNFDNNFTLYAKTQYNILV